MPNCKSFLVKEAERKHVRQLARFQEHRDVSFHQVFFLQGKVLKEIHAILTGTLGQHAQLLELQSGVYPSHPHTI